MHKLCDLILENKLPSYIILTFPYNSVEPKSSI